MVNRIGAGLVSSAAAVLLLASHVHAADGRWNQQLAALPGDSSLSYSEDLSYSYSFSSSFDMDDDGESSTAVCSLKPAACVYAHPPPSTNKRWLCT